MKKTFRMAGMGASLLLFAIFSLMAFPIIRDNIDAEAAMYEKNSTTTLTMSTSYNSANLDIYARGAEGVFAATTDEDTAKFAVTTNNTTGYNLSILATDDTKQLSNTEIDAETGEETVVGVLNSVTSATSADDFNDAEYNGKWGYKPSKYYDEASKTVVENTDFLPAPTTDGTTLDVTKSANVSTANDYTIGLGARVDYDSPAGSYTNTFVLTAVGNYIDYSITYSDNTGDESVSNLPVMSSGSTDEAKIAISTTVPTRTGYEFLGWCNAEPIIKDDGSMVCSGESYMASTASTASYFYIEQTGPNYTANITTLYAVWKPQEYTFGIFFGFSEESWVDSVQIRTEAGTAGELIGIISKSGGYITGVRYKDSFYLYPVFKEGYEFLNWTEGPGGGSLSSVSSENPIFTMGADSATVVLYAKASCVEVSGSLQDFTGKASGYCSDTGTLIDSRDGQSYTVKKLDDGNWWMIDNLNLGAIELTVDLTPENTNLEKTIQAYDFNSSRKTGGTGTTASSEYVPLSGTDSVSGTSYGTLYNYHAASARTIYSNAVSGDALYDICPKGWRLPTGGSSGELQALYNNPSYNSYDKMRAPISEGGAAFALAGEVYRSVPAHQGSEGHYWTSTRISSSSNDDTYVLALVSSDINTNIPDNRMFGYSIRCILNTRTISDVTNMQDVTKTVIKNTEHLDTATLTDARDGQEYTVVKYNDLLWMTRNLAIGCDGSGSSYGSSVSSKQLTRMNSNVLVSWDTPTDLLTAGNSYDDARMMCDSTHGAWYNYAAATAGTITGEENETNATYDICPKGWRLFTSAEMVSRNSSFKDAFNAVLGGYYSGGRLYQDDTIGYWWSATAYSSAARENFHSFHAYDYLSNSYLGRNIGSYVRCVKSA